MSTIVDEGRFMLARDAKEQTQAVLAKEFDAEVIMIRDLIAAAVQAGEYRIGPVEVSEAARGAITAMLRDAGYVVVNHRPTDEVPSGTLTVNWVDAS